MTPIEAALDSLKSLKPGEALNYAKNIEKVRLRLKYVIATAPRCLGHCGTKA